MRNVLSIVMAGGEGKRLSALSKQRAKPAVPFGGTFRIIDFTLSNIMHAGGRSVGIITQYRPHSLVDHLGTGENWGLGGYGSRLRCLYPHTADEKSRFYSGNADAVYNNLEFIYDYPRATEVLVLSGDHIYRMDYLEMLLLHRENRARCTIATQQVPWEETSRFGILEVDERQRVVNFVEKPKTRPRSNLASLGIYCFDRETLVEALLRDQTEPDSEHDFGGNIIPRLIDEGEVFQYEFKGYWRDVGTIESYMACSMELLDGADGLDLAAWKVQTNHSDLPLLSQFPTRVCGEGRVRDSLVSKGCVIEGEVDRSVLSPGVFIAPGAVVRRSVLLNNVQVQRNAVIEDTIVDKNCHLGDSCRLGDPELGDDVNAQHPKLLYSGISVVGKDTVIPPFVRFGRNVLIQPATQPIAIRKETYRAGSTI